ncbi:PAS domain S-box protein [Bacillus sp. S/N-304-OC-R1]|uniref:PAS domain S-box protein n=1 Tax=Bacillus sp. S/N-304-OC-R1 TaxID=2758034 RepID=UPI001C8D6031|nr:PAS domain-containing protein [Bacillus sp. S/N-304-OC-R1]MBY0120408.1 PAS domain S-box protein [Bacillus sp. S/N-304-OC-R1]
MLEILELINPMLIFVAIILTFICTYTGMDLFSLVIASERNRKFLFLGGTFSLGVGLWIMNFIGMLAVNTASSSNLHIMITILSLLFGTVFTGIAFYGVVEKEVKTKQIWISSFFMTAAVFSIHSTGLYGTKLNIGFHLVLFIISVLFIFGAFSLALWMLFFSKSLSPYNEVWIKPVSAIIVTGAIIEGNLLLLRTFSIDAADIMGHTDSNPKSFTIYFVLFISLLILSGIIGSRTVIGRRLADSDHYLRYIEAALDESTIVAITDSNGIITYVNDKFIEISKYSKEEILGKTHRVLNSKFHPPEFFSDLWKTISSGEVWRGEIRNVTKDGTFYWVNTTIVPFLNSEGKPYQYVSIRNDVTALKETEVHLKDKIKEVSDIKFALDQSSIVAITDEKGIITSVNDKFCEISKYSREELIGCSHSILNSGYHSKEFFRNLWHTIKHGEVWKGDICNAAKDGTFYWVDTTIVPFLNKDGKPYQYLAIRNDITEKKKTEEALHRQDKLATVGQLAAGVAHEIRNPLTSMKGYTEFLQMDEKNSERLEYFDIILNEIDRVNHIVEDFMLLAKPKSVDLKEKNIILIMKNVMSLFEFDIKSKRIDLYFESSEPSILIKCDEYRLKQVFINFIKNAIDAMPNGGELQLSVSVKNETVYISILDSGVGIPPEKLNKIGEPFFTTKKKGNGLGLMVSFQIIESHGGKVHVESEINKGTIFTIMLPLYI